MKAEEKSLRGRVSESKNVENFRDWESGKMRRTYYDLYGKNRRYRGDGAKVYVDRVRNVLIIERVNGTQSREFSASFEALREEFPEHIFRD